MDYWGEMPFYQLDLWELKTAFAGVFTASRVSQAAFRSAAVPSHILCASPAFCVPSKSRGGTCLFCLRQPSLVSDGRDPDVLSKCFAPTI